MSILDRYLMKQVAGGILISTLVLLPLFSFLDLVDQLDDVGTGFYRTSDAFLYVMLTLPRRFIQLLPFIALLGNVTALGRLALNQELISLRSAGYSPVQISMASMKVGLLLLLIVGLLELFVAPPLVYCCPATFVRSRYQRRIGAARRFQKIGAALRLHETAAR